MTDTIIAEPFKVEATAQEVIHDGRNKLLRAKWQNSDIVLKTFGRPLLRGWEYVLRKSKARRSYENAMTLLERGIDTPAPIAYSERRAAGTKRLISCTYICRYEPSQALADFYDNADSQFIRDFARFVAALHEKGIRHDDLNNTNIRVKGQNSTLTFSLIDLNRMRIYPAGQAVPLDECLVNITRFSGLDNTFASFVDEYLKARNLPYSLKAKAIQVKKEHDDSVSRKKKLKRLFK